MSQEKLNLLSSILGVELELPADHWRVDPYYLRVTNEILEGLIAHNFIDPEEESVKEVKEFLDSNTSFSVKVLLSLKEEPYVEVVGVVTHTPPEADELCAFATVFRSHDEFYISPEHCFCRLD